MKNAFEEMMPKEVIPAKNEEKVMGAIKSIDSLLKISDLFTVKFSQTIAKQVSGNKKK